MPAASSNPYPFVTMVEQASAPLLAPSGDQRLFMASGSNALYAIDHVGAIRVIGPTAASMTNPMTTTGDLIYSSDNSGTPARLAAGASNAVLTALGAGIAPKWSPNVPPLLARQFYTRGTDGSIAAISSASSVDVDATNAAVTFTAPASTNVLVTASFLAAASATLNFHAQVRESTTVLQDERLYSGGGQERFTAEFYILGISAGSHTYKLGAYVSTSTMTIYGGPTLGPLVLTVWDAG